MALERAENIPQPATPTYSGLGVWRELKQAQNERIAELADALKMYGW